MAKFKLTNKAVEDLSNIWDYTFDNWSETQADKYYNLILHQCGEFATQPEIVKIYKGIANSLYGFRINKHIIFYRIMNENQIEVARILHERMDLKNRIIE